MSPGSMPAAASSFGTTLYKPFGVKPFMGGNTGVCMGGWFRHELNSSCRPARAQAALARPRRRGLSPARRHAADHAAGGDPHQPAIGRARRRRIRRPRLRHRARALSRGAVLLLSRLQQAERHRRMHRRAESLERAFAPSCRRSSRMPARRRRPMRWPRWSGSMPRRLEALTQQHNVKLTAFPGDLVTAARKAGDRRARRTGGPQRHHRQGACILHGLPCPHRALVAGVDRGGAARPGGVSGKRLPRSPRPKAPALESPCPHGCATHVARAQPTPYERKFPLGTPLRLTGH